MLESGANNNNYGYGNLKATGVNKNANISYLSKQVWKFKINAALESMEEQIIDKFNDPNYRLLIQSYYLAGVRVSGSSLLTGSVKVNEKSKIYFDKVISLTEHNEYNIYRIFSEHWTNKGNN